MSNPHQINEREHETSPLITNQHYTTYQYEPNLHENNPTYNQQEPSYNAVPYSYNNPNFLTDNILPNYLTQPLETALNEVDTQSNQDSLLNVNITGEFLGPSVTCRICEVEISLDGRTNQHVVRCQHCQEVTPIKAAPPGKKYVRCPCNCLLVCKASSNRIACPRANCRRVITLVASAPTGTAVRAPAGTCRVQCAHCNEMFMFNSLMNAVATCPHCRKCSSVGSEYARGRVLFYFCCTTGTLLAFLFISVS